MRWGGRLCRPWWCSQPWRCLTPVYLPSLRRSAHWQTAPPAQHPTAPARAAPRARASWVAPAWSAQTRTRATAVMEMPPSASSAARASIPTPQERARHASQTARSAAVPPPVTPAPRGPPGMLPRPRAPPAKTRYLCGGGAACRRHRTVALVPRGPTPLLPVPTCRRAASTAQRLETAQPVTLDLASRVGNARLGEAGRAGSRVARRRGGAGFGTQYLVRRPPDARLLPCPHLPHPSLQP